MANRLNPVLALVMIPTYTVGLSDLLPSQRLNPVLALVMIPTVVNYLQGCTFTDVSIQY